MKGKLTWTLTDYDGKVISKPDVLSNGYTPHIRFEKLIRGHVADS